ncbi:hypothetical protein V6N13_097516 [Hibiscus sabdariffa]
MMGYIQTLKKLGFPLKDELATDVILQSLPDSLNQFMLNFNMNEINKSLPQLLGMLRTGEGNMKKSGSKSILMVLKDKEKGKKVAKSKGSGETKPKGKNALKPKGGISKEGKCFHCDKFGHWKRNCPVYLEEVMEAKSIRASVSGIYVIDVNMSTSTSWVLDTSCGSHICTSVQGLHMRRNLAKGEVDLRVGNGARLGDVIHVDQDEPKTYQKPVSSLDNKKCLEAMRSEIDSMSENQQMDVKTAFLNGKLKEDMYMTQPEGCVARGNVGKVCKLQRSIYGLKQASRSWNLRFLDAIKEFPFIKNEDEPCEYKKIRGRIVSL